MAPQDTPTHSRPIMGEDGPADSALAASSDWRYSPSAVPPASLG